MAPTLAILACLGFIALTVRADRTPAMTCWFACQRSMDNATFSTTVETDDYYTGACEDSLRLRSTFLCCEIHCPYRSDTESGLGNYLDMCNTYTNIKVPGYDELQMNLSGVDPMTVRHFDFNGINSSDTIDTLLLPSDDMYKLAFDSWASYIHQDFTSFIYGYAMVGFWAFIFLVGIGNRAFHMFVLWKWPITYRHQSAQPGQATKPSYGVFGRIQNAFRKHIVVPATFGYRHQQPFWWCTVPTRLEFIIVWSFVLLNVLTLALDYSIVFPDMYNSTVPSLVFDFIIIRAGAMACANLGILWLMGSRNDVFLWLTGWSFGTMNVFHRWVARLTTAEAVIHGIGYTVTKYWYGGGEELAEAWQERYWWCGAISTICMSFLLIFSMFPIRTKYYEIFLTIHRVLAMTALVALFYHLTDAGDTYMPFIWPAVAFWCVDYLVRWCRLLVLNFKIFLRGHTQATASYDAEHDIIRLTVFPSFHLAVQPGQYYFLYFPTLLKGFGNHPFTLAGWVQSGDRITRGSLSTSSPGSISSGEKNMKEVGTQQVITHGRPSVDGDLGIQAHRTQLEFLVRPQKGLTGSLKNKIIKQGGKLSQMRILLEGPYGMSHPLHDYDTILFIAGGTGISPVLGYLQSLRVLSQNRSVTQKLYVAWASRHESFVSEVLNRELRVARVSTDTQVDVFVTSGKGDGAALLSDGLTERISVHYGRPNAYKLVTALVNDDAPHNTESIAVFVCGPAGLSDDTRYAVKTIIGKRPGSKIDYYEEEFGW